METSIFTLAVAWSETAQQAFVPCIRPLPGLRPGRPCTSPSGVWNESLHEEPRLARNFRLRGRPNDAQTAPLIRINKRLKIVKTKGAT